MPSVSNPLVMSTPLMFSVPPSTRKPGPPFRSMTGFGVPAGPLQSRVIDRRARTVIGPPRSWVPAVTTIWWSPVSASASWMAARNEHPPAASAHTWSPGVASLLAVTLSTVNVSASAVSFDPVTDVYTTDPAIAAVATSAPTTPTRITRSRLMASPGSTRR